MTTSKTTVHATTKRLSLWMSLLSLSLCLMALGLQPATASAQNSRFTPTERERLKEFHTMSQERNQFYRQLRQYRQQAVEARLRGENPQTLYARMKTAQEQIDLREREMRKIAVELGIPMPETDPGTSDAPGDIRPFSNVEEEIRALEKRVRQTRSKKFFKNIDFEPMLRQAAPQETEV